MYNVYDIKYHFLKINIKYLYIKEKKNHVV